MSVHDKRAFEAKHGIRSTRPLASLLLLLFVVACGGAQKSSTTTAVVERAEGFSERPAWADPNSPFTRRENTVRVLGYVAIDAKQRQEAGFRAADSYARAELVRFLSTRIVAVLRDNTSTQEGGEISEAITESAHLLIDDLPIAAHYWEKVQEKDGATLHLYSRIDVDPQTVGQLLSRVWKEHSDLRTPLSEIQKSIEQNWDALGEVASVHSSTDLLPEGIYTPDWAKRGDQEDDQEFRFVCHGLATEEPQAQALAARMCTEKICKIFGVQIKSTTSVRENLEGLDVESEVVEGCLDVHIEGKATKFSGGECGPRGCVQWMMQSYPKSAYLAERKRLENPTTVERQIVVQEGSIKYTDPAVCEAELQSYGVITGQKLAMIEERLKILKRALVACQGIDARDSGLFARLWNLIEKPLPSFVTTSDRASPEFESGFLYGSSSWFEELSTARFIDERLRQIIALLEDSLLALRAYELVEREPDDLAKVQEVMKPLYAFPFGNVTASRTHSRNVHEVHQYRKKGQKDPEYFRFLAHEAEVRGYPCHWVGPLNGGTLIEQLAAHAPDSNAFWEAGIKVLKKAKASPGSCSSKLLKAQPSASLRMQRAEELLGMLKSGNLQLVSSVTGQTTVSEVEGLGILLEGKTFTPEESMRLYLAWEGQLRGTSAERAKLMQTVIKSFEPPYSERNSVNCSRYAQQLETLDKRLHRFPLEIADETTLCECLKDVGGLEGKGRERVVVELSKGARRTCKWVRDEEWPGGVGQEVKRPQPPTGATSAPRQGRNAEIKPGTPANPEDVASELKAPMKACLMNTEVENRSSGPLNAWVEISGTASAAGLLDPKVRILIKSSLRDLQRHDGKGWPSLADIRRTEDAAAACVFKVAKELRPTAGSQWAASSSRKIWLLFSSNSIVSSYRLNN